MSRIIKFRAWDNELNTMIYSDAHNKKEYQVEYYFTFNKNGETACWWEESYDDSMGYPASNGDYLDNIMQYTGLNDKNGKELYEGDIVKENNSIGKIIYNDCEFRIIWITNKDFYNDVIPRHNNYCEVIGNIYKNPELLER